MSGIVVIGIFEASDESGLRSNSIIRLFGMGVCVGGGEEGD